MKANINNELANCPFCNSTVRRVKGIVNGLTMFSCSNNKCGATISFRHKEDIESATQAFNKRYYEKEV